MRGCDDVSARAIPGSGAQLVVGGGGSRGGSAAAHDDSGIFTAPFTVGPTLLGREKLPRALSLFARPRVSCGKCITTRPR